MGVFLACLAAIKKLLAGTQAEIVCEIVCERPISTWGGDGGWGTPVEEGPRRVLDCLCI